MSNPFNAAKSAKVFNSNPISARYKGHHHNPNDVRKANKSANGNQTQNTDLPPDTRPFFRPSTWKNSVLPCFKNNKLPTTQHNPVNKLRSKNRNPISRYCYRLTGYISRSSSINSAIYAAFMLLLCAISAGPGREKITKQSRTLKSRWKWSSAVQVVFFPWDAKLCAPWRPLDYIFSCLPHHRCCQMWKMRKTDKLSTSFSAASAEESWSWKLCPLWEH